MTRKAPMTADEARENLAEMRRATSKPAMSKLLTLALGKHGNLSDEAREIYEEALKAI